MRVLAPILHFVANLHVMQRPCCVSNNTLCHTQVWGDACQAALQLPVHPLTLADHDREGNLSLMRYIASFPNNRAIMANHYCILNHVSIKDGEKNLQGVEL